MSTGGSFFDQFIEDYFAEADEHLAVARRVLLGLEIAAARNTPEPAQLRELFRSLHTLKGLSGMVGDVAAERIAHALEESLRGAEQRPTRLDQPFVDALFDAVELLERCIAVRRAGSSPPDAEAVIARLEAAAPPRVTAPADDGGAAARVDEVASRSGDGDETARGDVLYRFEFVPSAELARRGVGVDAVRARLQTLGRIIEAKPRVVSGGVTFDFTVAVHGDSAPDAAWAGDGLRWTTAPRDGGTATGAIAGRDIGGASAQGSPATSPGASASVVRVDLGRLDGVMRLVGDLVVSRSRLEAVIRAAEANGGTPSLDALQETNAAMERQLRQLRESVMRIRLVPFGEVFERLRFAARDAIRESGKRVAIAFHGQSTEIDKLVVDRMLEPLLHLVRNAVSHGIESPADRIAAGKSPDGTLTLRAGASGDRIRVEVEDDGAGIDLELVARKAQAAGLLGATEALTADRLLDVLSTPGFSTRDAADLTSGRGIGMDVVRSAIHALAGDLSLETTPGIGTRFVIELPLTLMILDALLVEIGGRQMAVPQPALREILQVESASIVAFENNDIIPYRESTLPLLGLAQLFGLADAGRGTVYVLVVGSEAAPMGLLVDRLLGLREIVVLPVADPLVAVPGIGGATELGDGRVTLILDAAALLRLAHDRRERRARGTSFNVRRAPSHAGASAPVVS